MTSIRYASGLCSTCQRSKSFLVRLRYAIRRSRNARSDERRVSWRTALSTPARATARRSARRRNRSASSPKPARARSEAAGKLLPRFESLDPRRQGREASS